MIIEYIERALKKAEYKKLEDGTWFGEIPGLNGVWANGKSLEVCRDELIEVTEEWLLLKIRDNESIPIIDGMGIRFGKLVS
ncbi:MAG: type II toxin-antitoxin system HicB family antitoxin [Ignavibacteria bacterium]|nr:type II toxin-antitoxin system HicB family antitoxin [Ignavibacteria bacterium]